jgi:hypothetical protein
MEDYRSRLKEQLKEINTLLDRSDRDIERLKDVPRYEIRIHKSNGCDQYHLVDKTTGNKRYVKAGDTLLVYDSSPLVYYLTDTRPFAGISWPCVFYGKQYVRKFMQAERETSTMPVLVMQYFYSSNNWSEIQDDYYALDSRMAFSNLDMKQNILRFIGEHRYKTAWSNGYYKIMIPKERLDQN